MAAYDTHTYFLHTQSSGFYSSNTDTIFRRHTQSVCFYLCMVSKKTSLIVQNGFIKKLDFLGKETALNTKMESATLPGRPDNGVCPDNVGEKHRFCPCDGGFTNSHPPARGLGALHHHVTAVGPAVPRPHAGDGHSGGAHVDTIISLKKCEKR